MCGRFTYLYKWQQLARLMRLVQWPQVELEPRFNVAPTQVAPVVRHSADCAREGLMLRWGLVPHWSDDLAIGNRHINARSETAASKPAFRQAFAQRRCIVPVSGFYEWRLMSDGRTKQPYRIGRIDGEPFMLGGLWDRSMIAGVPLESFTILTTSPNGLMAALHDRMPVLVAESDHDLWLDRAPLPESERARILQPAEMEGFEALPVSRLVNNPKVDTPEVAARVPEPDESSGFLF
jgi:putative SOS response-associated peptidase YedK